VTVYKGPMMVRFKHQGSIKSMVIIMIDQLCVIQCGCLSYFITVKFNELVGHKKFFLFLSPAGLVSFGFGAAYYGAGEYTCLIVIMWELSLDILEGLRIFNLAYVNIHSISSRFNVRYSIRPFQRLHK
jgi:hypothetical protein